MDLEADGALLTVLFCTCVEQHSVTLRDCVKSSEFLQVRWQVKKLLFSHMRDSSFPVLHEMFC